MAQLNVYVSDELEKKIKDQAKREKKSVSAFVLDAVKTKIEPGTWSPAFLKLLETEPVEVFAEVSDDLRLRAVHLETDET